ncbi:YpdA family putative bacillithiol disulfide reductase [Desmospora profundinema]|uniref:Thioredoxin reductase (NADPH) n=1 Tax=Desmospora profundinema TaxID=1571184 RepID=A0ABU1IL49_9BACL|nr:thioredoxin reductase (NADPH) [Desmospora profundinema]
MEEVIVIGAGPCGLSTAIEVKKRGIPPLVIEKGSLVNSVYHFPTFMQFFSTPELLEIGGLPFVTSGEKPVRGEALKYYRAVVKAYDLQVNTYERVMAVDREADRFVVRTQKLGADHTYETSRLVVATGYYDSPNLLGVPGEELPKVRHYYQEGHPYAGLDVLVIGGKNSAVDAAMDLYQAGARVTMAYRRGAFTDSVKPWVKPVIESAIRKGWITMHWNTVVKEIAEDHVVLEKEGKVFTLPNQAVFAMTGYHPQTEMLTRLGVTIDPKTGGPVHNPDTMETEVPGLYIAGVIAAGRDANSIFIENGRFHGGKIAAHIEEQMGTTS